MKRFLVFVGDVYYPLGGMNDFVSDHDNEVDAVSVARERLGILTWAHVYDTELGQITKRFRSTT